MNDLNRLFYWRGIANSYHDFRGEYKEVPIENRIKLLHAMGIDTSDTSTLYQDAFDLDTKHWLNWLPPLSVCPAENPYIDIAFSQSDLDTQISCVLKSEQNDDRCIDFCPCELEEIGNYHHKDQRYSRRRLPIGDTAPNYYQLQISAGDRRVSGELVVAPSAVYAGAVDDPEKKIWGMVLQLYTLRSKSNWGIGDFSDLHALIEKAAARGVDMLGVNPFHALSADLEHNYSPYSPSDRRYLCPLYIDVERAPGYSCAIKPHEDIAALQANAHVQYIRVKSIKYRALMRCFEAYLAKADLSALYAYIQAAPEDLLSFADYEAWYSWRDDLESVDNQRPAENTRPEALSKPSVLAALRDFDHSWSTQYKRVVFHCYLQWLATTQLEACQQRAEALGMRVGIVRDLAVGASGDGAEIASNTDLFCRNAAIGAPPDPLALTGQNWGIPPMDPAKMRSTAFKHYRELLRANMQHCGALRIDHAMSLYRLWWIPPGCDADKGSYVYYPFLELMNILCLESYLNRTVIVAEDMGVVPDEFRHEMALKKLYGNRIAYFEKHNAYEFKHPNEIEEHVLTMLNNHDSPTLTAWWNGEDLLLREKLEMMEEGSELEALLSERRLEKQSLLRGLAEHKMLNGDWTVDSSERPIDFELVSALMCYFAKCKSRFFLIQLEDLLMMNEPVNVPGTHDEHKNWSRKLTRDLDDIFNDDIIGNTLTAIDDIRKQL